MSIRTVLGCLPRWIVATAVSAGMLAAQSCVGVGLALFGVGAGVASGTGVSYTLDSIAYKTFTVPEPQLTPRKTWVRW